MEISLTWFPEHFLIATNVVTKTLSKLGCIFWQKLHFTQRNELLVLFMTMLIYCCISIIEGYWVNDGHANWTCQPHEERRSQQSFSSTPGILSDLSRHTVTTPGKCLSFVQIYNRIILFYFTCLNIYWLFPTEIILSWGSLHWLFVWHKEYNDMHCTDLYNLPDRRKMLRT